ncbi:SDR family NAD(P)-dependent oxidoreductase [Arthrobacter bambusae]|uniref:Short-subunit dehydrogenase n=1 Tax=Arthrobacter bambusae TaxID=1338426 RepID=A0AAW8DFN6_9MICC|nr:SDR family NAD(P)-dependent oxidoreductase [Arthrobacter bambusae]MDP9907267.1 short-subunit dehydrogenase [Arthrobacter bambusae]MDQ0131403.1 short-subunit dehydrogenase [Arthrobacter bambusae]MDQ0182737.1 short-subunit dehydrogenase [Arthrobacter bambusae]
MNTTASTNPLAIITGASNGIGYQLALQLAQHGHDLVATGRSDRIFQAAEDFRKYGVEVTPVQADLSRFEEVERFWKESAALGRPIAVAVINAGIGIGGAPFWGTDLEEELKLIDVNVTSVVHLAKRVVTHMQANRSGRILFTSSISATQPTPYETVYGPSRAFVFSFAESLREELKSEGVSVTALLPGATDSDFHARAGMGNTDIGRMKKNDRVMVAKQGYEAMMKGKDQVVGGDWATKRAGFLNRFLTETYKAARQGRAARP